MEEKDIPRLKQASREAMAGIPSVAARLRQRKLDREAEQAAQRPVAAPPEEVGR